jgi:hypothetical protein
MSGVWGFDGRDGKGTWSVATAILKALQNLGFEENTSRIYKQWMLWSLFPFACIFGSFLL